MLKKRELHECQSLYNLMMDPAVSPYVRYACQSQEEMMFLTRQLIAEEEQGTVISRTILNETGTVIGTIDLYHIVNHTGFLATWIGAPYFGNGYSQRAKSAFLTELFLEHGMQTVFMKIRKQNVRSRKAVEKLPYVSLAHDLYPEIVRNINMEQPIFDLYHVDRDSFLASGLEPQHMMVT
ncbi:GNAT family N-acetyltransferase [Paenibacillus barcinonensis]|uniref:GNAT family N-acetyltransferase n=1 Tax=Paenibacillus TaxID=44249 RepID=UPI001C10656C|nr:MULTISPECIES: GNAT family protein [Paenibacillus]MBU5351177.1 GNAT family N-acetyltransferase [Paenibacillus barcinonensis]MDM5278195.1 GNAT family protein [Paenibacillus silvae]